MWKEHVYFFATPSYGRQRVKDAFVSDGFNRKPTSCFAMLLCPSVGDGLWNESHRSFWFFLEVVCITLADVQHDHVHMFRCLGQMLEAIVCLSYTWMRATRERPLNERHDMSERSLYICPGIHTEPMPVVDVVVQLFAWKVYCFIFHKYITEFRRVGQPSGGKTPHMCAACILIILVETGRSCTLFQMLANLYCGQLLPTTLAPWYLCGARDNDVMILRVVIDSRGQTVGL